MISSLISSRCRWRWTRRSTLSLVALLLLANVGAGQTPPKQEGPSATTSDRVLVTHVLDDTIYVGTERRFACLQNGTWRQWGHKDGLPPFAVSAIAVDPETRDVWLGTRGGGLVRFTAGRFDVFTQLNSGLAGDLVFAVTVAGRRVWAATNGGLSAFEPFVDRWDLHFARQAGGEQMAVTRLSACASDLYAEARGRGPMFFDVDHETWRPVAGTPRETQAALCVQREKARNRSINVQLPGSVSENTAPCSDPSMAVAIYGPRNRTITLPGAERGELLEPERPELTAVERAVETFNKTQPGALGGNPVELIQIVPGYARYGWGLPEDDLIAFSRDSRVRGIVGYVGREQNILQEAIQRTRIPWVDVASDDEANDADSDTDSTGDAWIFQCRGDEARRHRRLIEYLMQELGCRRFAAVRSAQLLGASRTEWWAGHIRRSDFSTVVEVGWPVEDAQQSAVIEQLKRAAPDAVMAAVPPEIAATILRRIRAAGLTSVFVVGSEIAIDGWSESAGLPPGRVLAWLPPGDSEARAASAAVRSFDATDHLLQAVVEAGDDREQVRRTLERMRDDIFGEAHYERTHPPTAVTIAELGAGRWERRILTPQSNMSRPSDFAPP